jgi:hypothetical protein
VHEIRRQGATDGAVGRPIAVTSYRAFALLAALGEASCTGGPSRIDAAALPALGTVDIRYQSYNVEMVEVTGGKFWKPYASKGQPSKPPSEADTGTPHGMNPDLYEYRTPIDLASPRLRKLAAALAPAYLRVSGTWANSTYFDDTDALSAKTPPGFLGTLTRSRWAAVIDFSRAVDAPIVTSFATSTGTRDSAGVWQPSLARRWLDATRTLGGNVAAVEFMNEPTLADIGGAPPGYAASDYGRDFRAFLALMKHDAPGIEVAGPGSSGERDGTWRVQYASPTMLKTKNLLAATGAGVDVFSYHYYGALSERCAPNWQTKEDEALSEKWLSGTDDALSFYRRMRDEFEPEKPLWLTETAQAACGGNRWASAFVDTFRYLDQLGRLAKQHVQVVFHNTLAASDYALLEEADLTPRPNYWAALVWRKLMGTTVLDAGVSNRSGLHVYAHCLRGTPGGVALLAINPDREKPHAISVSVDGSRYALSSPSSSSKTTLLNGTVLALTPDGDLPAIEGVPVPRGDVVVPAASIVFVALPKAGNAACGPS